MWSDQNIIRLRPGCQFLCFQQTAKVCNIRLNDISRLQLKELTIVIAGVDALSGRYGNGDLLRGLFECGEGLRRHRFLDPRWVETPMHLDQYLYIGTNCIVDCLNQFDDTPFISSVKFVEA